MENTKDQLENEVAQRHTNTLNEKADVMGAEVKETISKAKLEAVNLTDRSSDKAEDLKDDASSTWEDAKDKAEDIGDTIGEKYDELKAKAKSALS